MKWKLTFAIIILCFLLFPNSATDFYSKFHQKDYKLDFQRLEMDDYNKSVCNFVYGRTFKYNRTFTAGNFTINLKENMSTGLEFVIQMYKFLSNEYRIMRGSRFQLNMCKAIKANIVGLQVLFGCGNFGNCQLIKDRTYRMCNVYPDESRFPPYLPTGEYRFRIEVINDDAMIFIISLYVKIYRPIAIPRLPK